MSSSFALKAYTEVLSYDFFYPSNCNLTQVEDKGSIQDSLSVERFNIFDKETLDIPLYQNIVAVVARAFLNLAIGLIVAPIGAMVNALHLGWYLTAAMTDQNNPETWKKVGQYLSALFADLCFTIAMAFGPTILAAGLIEDVIQDVIGGIFYTALISALSTMPDFVLPYITEQEDRAGFYKSIMLKSEFGIVSENGKLLSFDREKDQESEELDGHFSQIYQQQAQIFLKLLNRLQRSLPENNHLSPFYPPKWESIERQLSATEIAKWQGQFLKIESNIKRMEEIIKKSIELRHTDLCNGASEVNMPFFPWDRAVSDQFFDINHLTGWDRQLQEAQQVLENKILPENLELYKKRIMSGMQPSALLGLKDNETPAAAYRRSMLQAAPDKNPDYKDEATVIFRCIEAARQSLRNGDDFGSAEPMMDDSDFSPTPSAPLDLTPIEDVD